MQAGIAAVPDRGQIGSPGSGPVIRLSGRPPWRYRPGGAIRAPGPDFSSLAPFPAVAGERETLPAAITGTDRAAPAAAAVPDRVRQDG